jgi:cell wall-associated NlpC family hydrolase
VAVVLLSFGVLCFKSTGENLPNVRKSIAETAEANLGAHYLYGGEGDIPNGEVVRDNDVILENHVAYDTLCNTYCDSPPCENIRHFDCSGLFYYATTRSGVNMGSLRTVEDLYGASIKLSGKSDLQKGDLVFIYKKQTDNWHVGIYVGDGYIVHAHGASAQVVKWTLTDWNQYYADTNKYEIKYGDVLSSLV